jgi:hypothetical protein
MPEPAMSLFLQPGGFLYQYIFDCFPSPGGGRWMEETHPGPFSGEPFNVQERHFVLSMEDFFRGKGTFEIDHWRIGIEYLRLGVRNLRRGGLLDQDGVLTVVHRHTYLGLVWSEKPLQPTVRPYPLASDWCGPPWWWGVV